MPEDRRGRARPSRQTFIVRRLVVAGVLGAGLVGLFAITRTVIGGTEEPTPNESATAGVPAPDIASTPAPTTAAPAAPATTEPAGPRVPSASDPARILLVGDSQAQGIEPFIAAALAADDLTDLTTLTTFGRNSSGLVRPDFFDWPAKLRELVPTVDPDIVVMFIGGNETQQFLDMPGKPIDSPEWRAEYGRRVGEVADLLRADGRTLIWIGVPMPGEEWQRSRLAVQNDVVGGQLAARPDTHFVDTWTMFSGIDGSYAPLVLDPLSGTYRVVRSERDDFHLNVAGATILAEVVAQTIAEDLGRRGVTGLGERSIAAELMAPGRYTIAAGDSLSGIARRTGTTVGAIVAANGWADHNQLIVPGQDIVLPARTS